MAIATARVRAFPGLRDLENFIQTEAGVVTILYIFHDNNGKYVLVYNTV